MSECCILIGRGSLLANQSDLYGFPVVKKCLLVKSPRNMAFRKRRFTRKRKFRRRIGGRRVQMRRRRMTRSRPEVKITTQVASAVVVSHTTGFIRRITQVAQGLNTGERIGNKIQPVRLVMTMCWSTSLETCVRWAIIRVTDILSLSPILMTEIYENGALSFPSFESQRKRIFRHKYKVIKAGKLTINPTFGIEGTAGHHQVQRSINIKLRAPTYFVGSAATSAGAGRGHLFLVCLGDRAAASNEPHLTFTCRVFYTDS